MLFNLFSLSYVLGTVLLLESLFVSAQLPSTYQPVNRVIFDWIDDNGVRRNVNISDMREPYGLIRNLNNLTRLKNPFIRFPYINTPGKKMITVTTMYLSSTPTNSSIMSTKRQNITFNVIDSRCSNDLIENSNMTLSYVGYWQASNGTTLRDVTSVFGKSTNAIRQSVTPVSRLTLVSQTVGSWWHHLFNLVSSSSSSSTTTITKATSTTTSYITSTSISEGLMYMKNITLSCLRPGTSWNIIARVGLLNTGKNTATGAMCQISTTRTSFTKTTCPIIIISFFGGMKNEILFFHIVDTYQLNEWNNNDWNILNSTMIIPRITTTTTTTTATATTIRSMRIVITSYNGTTTTVSGTDYVLDSFSIIPKL